jgi:predicted RND superfamily exporter protein
MAIAVIGGLIVSTLLSLVFVPAFFILMDDLSRLFGRLFSRFVGPKDEPASEFFRRPVPAALADADPNARPGIAAE